MITHKLPAVQLTISDSAINLQDAIASAALDDQYALPEGANRAIIQCETNDLRYLFDGTDPTTSIGIICTASNGFIVTGDLSKLKMIRDGDSDVTLTVQVQTIYPGEH